VLGASQTAVIVAVPEAERVVAVHRAHLDPAASWGVPAHVTVLYPFVAPAALDDEAVRRLAVAVRSVAAFNCSFSSTGWFGRDVLWLAPELAEPFRELTTAVWRAFPDHPPYDGAYADLAPHLTVGRRDGDESPLAAVELEVVSQLPVTTYVSQVQLIAGDAEPDSWRTLHVLPLGAPD
jgi:2'-5' RNA ligase